MDLWVLMSLRSGKLIDSCSVIYLYFLKRERKSIGQINYISNLDNYSNKVCIFYITVFVDCLVTFLETMPCILKTVNTNP